MTHITKLVAAALLALGAGTTVASADECSGRSHTTGTVAGAAGGGLIGGLASHGSAGGIIGGAVVGGLAGNAIARNNDCHDQHRGRYYHNGRTYNQRIWSHGRWHYS
jgi:hypothetical protein